MKKTISRAAVILFWLTVWQAAAVRVDNRILLAGPIEVCARLGEELRQTSFYASVAGSLARIMAGFGIGMAAGVAIGACAFFWRALKQLLEPVVLAMKSVPVAAFVILVLIWSGSKNLAVPISFLVVFPYFYIHTLTGLAETDRDQLAFARVCGMRRLNRLLYVYRPALAPYLLSAARVTVGMGFKSGIAAEVIGIPEPAIGTRLYMSKVYLDTAGVLAWTVVVVLLSFLCEKIMLFLLRALFTMHGKPLPGRIKSGVKAYARQDAQGVTIPAMRKTYQGKTVVDLPGMRIQKGGRIALAGESGSGKTTWLKLVMGLVQPDGETAECAPPRIAPAFQEDCLFMTETAADNVRMVCDARDAGRIRDCLEQILPAGVSGRCVSELSGGMCRRVAVARAVLAGGDLILLDEPFRGLDAENKKKLAAFILQNQADRVLIFTAHDEAEAALLEPEKTVAL
ncbi:MAG: ATP-binding cassette domain-containing protein [Clostridium sp.]|nr:ATP-binding cassette domain-containing protein [Clostridium sp.]